MNQESKVINVHLEKRENKDYLVFGFEEAAEVCLNDDESQNNLKSIFVKLLTEITKYPIELQFLEKPEYKTGLYIDVCKEYIKDLNKEITNVRKNMPEKLKMQWWQNTEKPHGYSGKPGVFLINHTKNWK